MILDISSQDRDLFTPVVKQVVYQDTPIIGLLFENNFLSSSGFLGTLKPLKVEQVKSEILFLKYLHRLPIEIYLS